MIDNYVTYRFMYDHKNKYWRTATPRRWQTPGYTRRGFQVVDIDGCPTYYTRDEIGGQMPAPPPDATRLSYDDKHRWSNT